MTAIPVAVVVMTRNEAANLAACLRTLIGFDQIFVVDSGSADGTREIAHQFGVILIDFDWNRSYPKKKQWCLDQLPFRHHWVLFVDADERVTPALATEIAGLISAGPIHAGYFIVGQPVFLHRRLRYGQRNLKIALLDRGRSRYPECPDLAVETMWEVEGHYQPRLDGSSGRLRAPMLHEDSKSLFEWFARHNRYSDWEAILAERGWRDSLAAAEPGWRGWVKRQFHRLPGQPIIAFGYCYLWRLGFLDGVPGLHFALTRAFYYWQISVKRQAIRRATGNHTTSSADRASSPNTFSNSKARRRTDESVMR